MQVNISDPSCNDTSNEDGQCWAPTYYTYNKCAYHQIKELELEQVQHIEILSGEFGKKIKELEQRLAETEEKLKKPYQVEASLIHRLAEAETYKKDWQDIAGRANLEHLCKRITEAEKVIEFYASEKNWSLRHSNFDEVIYDGDSGKRAREYQEKYKQMENEIKGRDKLIEAALEFIEDPEKFAEKIRNKR